MSEEVVEEVQTETESTPVEAVDTPEVEIPQQDEAIIEPEKKVSESVPYDRFKEVNDELKVLKEQLSAKETQQVTEEFVQPVESNFDEDTTNFVKQVYAQEREREKVEEFVRKNSEKLADPVLRGAVKEIIAEARTNGQYIDQNDALTLAERQIEARLSSKVTEAKASGEKEGLDIANKKEQLGAVGTTAGKSEINPEQLSTKEMKEFYGLTYVE